MNARFFLAPLIFSILAAASLHGEEKVSGLLFQIPLVLLADGNEITTKVSFPLSIIPLDKDLSSFITSPSDESDRVLASFLKAIREGDLDTFKKDQPPLILSDDGKTTFNPAIQNVEIAKTSFFPKEGSSRFIGKIPLEKGAAYLLTENDSDGVDDSIIPVLSNTGTPLVYLMNPWAFLDLLNESIERENPENRFKNGEPIATPSVLTKNNLDTFILSRADLAIVPEIVKTIDLLEAHSGRDSFTNIEPSETSNSGQSKTSQQEFDADQFNPSSYLQIDPKQKAEHLKTFISDARQIAYVLNFDPFYISIQKKGVEQTTIFYYLKDPTGKLRITNLDSGNENGSRPFDRVLQKLPPPNPELLAKFAVVMNGRVAPTPPNHN